MAEVSVGLAYVLDRIGRELAVVRHEHELMRRRLGIPDGVPVAQYLEATRGATGGPGEEFRDEAGSSEQTGTESEEVAHGK